MDLTPYIPQIITAVATLGGVVLTLIFTGRREGKRLAQQLAFERERILADERRQVFTRTAHALQRMKERLDGREQEVEDHGWDAWGKAVTHRADELFELQTEIRLLAPTLTNNVRAATQTARSIRDAPAGITAAEMSRLQDEYLRYTMKAMTQMRSILGTEPSDATELTPGERAMREGLI